MRRQLFFAILITYVCYQNPLQINWRVPVIRDSGKEISSAHQEKAKPKQQNPNPSTTGNKPDSAANSANQHPESNKNSEVRITDIPAITLIRDNVALIISIVLGVVGVIGIIVAWRTLNKIAEQTDA